MALHQAARLLAGRPFTGLKPCGWPAAGITTLAHEDILSEPPSEHPGDVPTHTVLVLHGLLGSARNWRTFSRALGDAAAKATKHKWRMVLVDLRCHGASSRLHDLHPPHNMESAAADVVRLIAQEHRQHSAAPLAILGHSMGGKVLLEVLRQLHQGTSAQHTAQGHQAHRSQHTQHALPAQHAQHDQDVQHDQQGSGGSLRQMSTQPHPGLLPAQAWVLDSQPGRVTAAADAATGVAKVLQVVDEVKLPIPSRTWLTTYLKGKGFNTAMAAWLGSNVGPDAQGNLSWVFNPQGAAAMYHSYMLTEYWGLLRQPPQGTRVHLVRGGRSDRWPHDLAQRVEELAAHHKHAATAPHSPAGQAAAGQQHSDSNAADAAGHGSFSVHVLPKAGHWLHVDDPDGLLKLILPHLCAEAQRAAPSQHLPLPS